MSRHRTNAVGKIKFGRCGAKAGITGGRGGSQYPEATASTEGDGEDSSWERFREHSVSTWEEPPNHPRWNPRRVTRENLDDVDRQIVALLQENARYTATEIGDVIGVSDTTVINRMNGLEEAGVIRGYQILVDYERAGLQRPFLFTCTVPIVERETFAESATEIPGVVTVIESMTGQENLLVEAVGNDPDDMTRVARSLSELGIEIVDETVVNDVHQPPLGFFRSRLTERRDGAEPG